MSDTYIIDTFKRNPPPSAPPEPLPSQAEMDRARAFVEQFFPSNVANKSSAAGVAVRAADTGRVLMLQRAIEDDDDRQDPAAGKWEFPGGHLEDGDGDEWQGASREWQEEVGLPMPDGRVAGTSLSPNGVYRLFVLEVPSEDDVPINEGDRSHDPDGDKIESLAWWAPEDAQNMKALRQELQTADWSTIAGTGVGN